MKKLMIFLTYATILTIAFVINIALGWFVFLLATPALGESLNG